MTSMSSIPSILSYGMKSFGIMLNAKWHSLFLLLVNLHEIIRGELANVMKLMLEDGLFLGKKKPVPLRGPIKEGISSRFSRLTSSRRVRSSTLILPNFEMFLDALWFIT